LLSRRRRPERCHTRDLIRAVDAMEHPRPTLIRDDLELRLGHGPFTF
jgi:hypothetical protein